LAPNADDRFASATELADALRRERDGGAMEPPRGVPSDTGTAETIIRPVAAAAASAGAAAAGGSSGAAPPPAPPSGGGGSSSGGPPGAGPAGGGSSKRRSRKRRNTVIALVLLVVIVGAIAGVALMSSGEEATAGEIFLDPRNATRVGGANPFSTPAIDQAVAVPMALAQNLDAVPLPQPTSGGIASTSGGEPGLYGGTRDSSTCDPAKLVAFLHQNADKAAAWAKTLGIQVGEIDSYVSTLTSVLLRADTRVTNHGFESGAATAVQSVLEAGTAVLVDKFGVPRVKCFCGNPLLEPQAVRSTPVYQGPKWSGFQPTAVSVVTPAPQPITVIVVVDVETGEPFGRPVGTSGGSDENATLPPRGSTSSTTTAPRSTTTTTPATTTTKAKGSPEAAVAEMQAALQRCVEAVGGSGDASGLRYSAVPAGENGVFTVTVTAADNSEQGVWRLDLATKDFTPQDPVAAEVGALCPELG
jgi:hypothetical protein